ncbi:MAG: L-fucose/L-arabinose isomerase family protein [Anaerolineae bacterium]
MAGKKTTFALFFGNRGFFPGSLMAGAREELPRKLKEWGYDSIVMPADATRHGAVETVAEGNAYAAFLRQHRGEYGGVILSLPNFGDENGAIAALKDAGVPILVQAYPDDLDKMAPETRRDAFCGKVSVMDVFVQNGLKFTALKPHTVSPLSDRFRANVDYFDRVCRVVAGFQNLRVGAIGARTSAFKTVRIDEIALQRHGITMETLDLSDVFARMQTVKADGSDYGAKATTLKGYSSWSGVPEQAFDRLVRLGVVLDGVIEELDLQAIAVRCWVEMQSQLGISPCVLLSEINNRNIPAACEVDMGNAIAMHALSLASDGVVTCLDWNNNYGDDDDKCILFHCGPVPQAMMTGAGRISDHLILANSVGQGCGFGCNVGRIAPNDITFSSMLTDAGKLRFYLGQGKFTTDPIPADFFGCAGVAQIDKLQDVMQHVGKYGHRHHVSVTTGHVMAPVYEALRYYLGFEVGLPQNGKE